MSPSPFLCSPLCFFMHALHTQPFHAFFLNSGFFLSLFFHISFFFCFRVFSFRAEEIAVHLQLKWQRAVVGFHEKRKKSALLFYCKMEKRVVATNGAPLALQLVTRFVSHFAIHVLPGFLLTRPANRKERIFFSLLFFLAACDSKKQTVIFSTQFGIVPHQEGGQPTQSFTTKTRSPAPTTH